MKVSRSSIAKVAAVAGIALAAMGTVTVAQARSDVYFSIGTNVSPGVNLGVANYRPYSQYVQPVYVQPAPVYYQPAPVYYQSSTVYYQSAPVYYQPQSVYYEPAPAYVGPSVYGVTYVRPGWRHGWHHGRYYR